MVRGRWLACVLVLAMATAAWADPAPGPVAAKARHGWMAHTPLGKFLTGQLGRLMVLRSDLSVTDQQRADIKKILVTHKSEVVNQIKALWQKRVALRNAVLAEKTDEKAIRKAADNLGKAIGDAAVLAAKLKGQVAPILTSEQKGLVKKFLADSDKATDKLFGQPAQEKAVKTKAK